MAIQAIRRGRLLRMQSDTRFRMPRDSIKRDRPALTAGVHAARGAALERLSQ
jgi:hypothetical protein